MNYVQCSALMNIIPVPTLFNFIKWITHTFLLDVASAYNYKVFEYSHFISICFGLECTFKSLRLLRYKPNDKSSMPSFAINNNLLIQLNYLFRFHLRNITKKLRELGRERERKRQEGHKMLNYDSCSFEQCYLPMANSKLFFLAHWIEQQKHP